MSLKSWKPLAVGALFLVIPIKDLFLSESSPDGFIRFLAVSVGLLLAGRCFWLAFTTTRPLVGKTEASASLSIAVVFLCFGLAIISHGTLVIGVMFLSASCLFGLDGLQQKRAGAAQNG